MKRSGQTRRKQRAVANSTLHLHFYLPIASDYSVDTFVKHLRGSVEVDDLTRPNPPPPDRFRDAGVYLDFRTTAGQGTDSFKRSLQDTGSVVVYLGTRCWILKTSVLSDCRPWGSALLRLSPVTVN
jgi:hypothetical protein